MRHLLSEPLKELTGRLIGLARATEGNEHMITASTAPALMEGLAALASREQPDREAVAAIMESLREEKRKLVPDCFLCASPCGRTADYDLENLRGAPEEVRALKYQILLCAGDLAASIRQSGGDEKNHNLLYRALIAVGIDEFGGQELAPILLEMEQVRHGAGIQTR